MIWFYVGAFILGNIFGSIFVSVWHIIKSPNAGTLVIDQTDSEKDTYRIEVSEDLNSLPKRKRIYLKIKLEK